MPRPQRKAPPYDPEAVAALVTRQAGVVSRRQLSGLGVTPADLKRFVRRRGLFRLGPGVYVDHRGDLAPLQRLWWACLHYGRGAAADESALQLARDETGSHLTLPVHVAVGADHHVTPLPQVVVHRVSRLESIVGWTGTPPRMQPAHAALRVGSRAASENDVVSRLADAVNWRLVSAARLLEALEDLPSLPRRAFLREVLIDLKDGACSVLEREYLRRVEQAHGLPSGARQVPRRTPGGMEFRDVEYAGFGMVVELVGRAFHSSKQAWDADLERDLDDLVDTKHAARLGWKQVFGSPCGTAGKLARLFQQRGWDGRAVPCGPGCTIESDPR